MIRVANSESLVLDSIALNSGDVITLECKLLNNKPWYDIYHESQFNKSSYYDGNDFDRCMEMYSELMLAFKGLKRYEDVVKRKAEFLKKTSALGDYVNLYNKNDMYFSLKSNPLFLGMSDF